MIKQSRDKNSTKLSSTLNKIKAPQNQTQRSTSVDVFKTKRNKLEEIRQKQIKNVFKLLNKRSVSSTVRKDNADIYDLNEE